MDNKRMKNYLNYLNNSSKYGIKSTMNLEYYLNLQEKENKKIEKDNKMDEIKEVYYTEQDIVQFKITIETMENALNEQQNEILNLEREKFVQEKKVELLEEEGTLKSKIINNNIDYIEKLKLEIEELHYCNNENLI